MCQHGTACMRAGQSSAERRRRIDAALSIRTRRAVRAVQVKMTLLLAAVAVPINTAFGVVAALQLTRSEFPGKTFVMAMLDLPFSISPVVTGGENPTT